MEEDEGDPFCDCAHRKSEHKNIEGDYLLDEGQEYGVCGGVVETSNPPPNAFIDCDCLCRCGHERRNHEQLEVWCNQSAVDGTHEDDACGCVTFELDVAV